MQRVEKFDTEKMQKVFIAPYTVTIGDINYGRHLGL